MTDKNSDEILTRKFEDLAQRAYRDGIYTFSGFLSLAEQELLRSAAGRLPIKISLEGGSDAAERKIGIFGSEEDFGYAPELPVVTVSIAPVSEKYGEELSHRDYLGAVLALGIDRSTTGDIIVQGKHAWLFCLESMAGYIIQNLSEVRHTKVKCSVEAEIPPEARPVLREEAVNVASERADAIVAAVLNISRGRAAELFTAQRVYVDSRLAENGGKALKEGNTISIRGNGRFIYR